MLQRYSKVYRAEKANLLFKYYFTYKFNIFIFCVSTILFLLPFIDMVSIFALVVVFASLAVIEDVKLGNEIKKKEQSIGKDFPEVINKVVLFLSAGLSLIKAWEMSAEGKDSWLYREINQSFKEYDIWKSERRVFEDFASRCNSVEVSRVMAIFIQNSRFGNRDLLSVLKIQSRECWENRKNRAKKFAEEASAKMVFSTALIFIGILIIVIAPAIISMGEL